MNQEEQAPKRSLRSRLGRVFLWLLAIGILVYIFRRIPVSQVVDAASRLDLLIFLPVILFFCLLTLAFDSYTHQWVFNRFGLAINYKDTFFLRAKTYFLLSLGFLYGQGGMAYFTSRHTNKPLAETTGWIFFIMFCNLQVLLIFPTLAILLLLDRLAAPEFRSSPEFKLIVKWLIISWPLVIGQMIFFARDWNIGIRRRLKQGAFRAFDNAGWKDYGWVMFLRALQTLLWIFATWLAVRAFGLSIPLIDLAIRGPLIGLISVIPTPGRLGTTQGAWLLLFPEVPDQAALVAFSLVWTLGISILRWLIGVVFLGFGNK